MNIARVRRANERTSINRAIRIRTTSKRRHDCQFSGAIQYASKHAHTDRRRTTSRRYERNATKPFFRLAWPNRTSKRITESTVRESAFEQFGRVCRIRRCIPKENFHFSSKLNPFAYQSKVSRFCDRAHFYSFVADFSRAYKRSGNFSGKISPRMVQISSLEREMCGTHHTCIRNVHYFQNFWCKRKRTKGLTCEAHDQSPLSLFRRNLFA